MTKNENGPNDESARFAAQTEDAKRALIADVNNIEIVEPYNPIRDIIVNSLCFLFPVFSVIGLLIFSIPGLIGLAFLVIVNIKIIKNDAFARGVINAAYFFFAGTICSILFFALAIPLTVVMASFGVHHVP